MRQHRLEVTTPDQRTLHFATFGEASGPTVVFHHGTPGSASSALMIADAVTDAGMFIVALSRAGYGESSRRAGRSVGSVVEDTRVALDALGRDRYVAVGWSGGGPHALACAALDAPRCQAAWSLAGVAPRDVGFDWTEGMAQENVEEFAAAVEGGPVHEASIAAEAEHYAGADPQNVVELFGGLFSPPDLAALADHGLRARLATATREAFAGGYFGFYDDDRAFFSPWGFDPRDIAVPVQVWYADQDFMVPATHGAWLAENIPTATAVTMPGEGHLSFFVTYADHLAASLSRMAEV